jgi:hypothetical protein
MNRARQAASIVDRVASRSAAWPEFWHRTGGIAAQKVDPGAGIVTT